MLVYLRSALCAESETGVFSTLFNLAIALHLNSESQVQF